MRQFIVIGILTTIILATFVNTVPAQTTVEPFAFRYEELTTVNGDTKVIRVRYTATEKKQKDEERITELMAEPGLYMPQGSQQYADPRAAAEWQYYWEQLKLWEQYIQDQLLSNKTLNMTVSELNFVDPNSLDVQLEEIYNSHIEQAKKLSSDYYMKVMSMLGRIEDRIWQREVYRIWVDRNKQKLQEFAQEWLRQITGEEIEIEGKTYLVSPQPLKNVPENKVNIVTTNLTPYDLLNEDGSLKTVSENEGFSTEDTGTPEE